MIGSRPGRIVAAMSVAFAFSMSGPGHAADYFNGKRITVLINFAPGGSTDVHGRLFAKYLPKHLAAKNGGRPSSVIVQNMPGGGGITGANYLGEIAPKDGTMIGYFSGTAWAAVTDAKMFRIDYRTYEFIGYEPGTTIYFARRDLEPRLNAPEDVVKVKTLVAGGLSLTSDKDVRHRLTLDMLGVPFSYVPGYQSSSQARLAIEKKEIDFFSEAPGTYRTVIHPQFVEKAGTVLPLYFDPQTTSSGFRVPKAISDMNLVAFPDLYKKVKGKAPQGQLWDAYRAMITVTAAMQRVIVLPPGVNAEAAAALRDAIAAMNDDPELEAEGLKMTGYRPEIITASNVSKQVVDAMQVAPETLKFLEKYKAEPPK